PLTAAPLGAPARALLARPDLAALTDQVLALSADQRAELARAYARNDAAHSRSQIRICHRVSIADPTNHPDHAAVRAWMWSLANGPRDGHYGAAVAAADMAFVLLAGDLLTPAEQALFTAPWQAVCDPVGDTRKG
ncbi:MAG TPA: hypothetical protein VJT31_34925, partial [Rugosimonospora sp.]|nr:hypothetical protein [Rugosimonospora sp.]